MADFSTIVGYGMAVIMGTAGILIICGVLMGQDVPTQIRIIFGVVLVLYSVYRFMMTRTRSKQAKSPEE